MRARQSRSRRGVRHPADQDLVHGGRHHLPPGWVRLHVGHRGLGGQPVELLEQHAEAQVAGDGLVEDQEPAPQRRVGGEAEQQLAAGVGGVHGGPNHSAAGGGIPGGRRGRPSGATTAAGRPAAAPARAQRGSQSSRPVSCMITKSVRMAPTVTERPVKPSQKKVTEKSTR